MATVVQTPIIQARKRDLSGLRSGIKSITDTLDERRKSKALSEVAGEFLTGDDPDLGGFFAAGAGRGLDVRDMSTLANSIVGQQRLASSDENARLQREATRNITLMLEGGRGSRLTATLGSQEDLQEARLEAKTARDLIEANALFTQQGKEAAVSAKEFKERARQFEAKIAQDIKEGKITEGQGAQKIANQVSQFAKLQGDKHTAALVAALTADKDRASKEKIAGGVQAGAGQRTDATQAGALERTGLNIRSTEGIAESIQAGAEKRKLIGTGSTERVAQANREAANRRAASGRGVSERALAEKRRQFDLTQPLAERGVAAREQTAAAATENARLRALEVGAKSAADIRNVESLRVELGLEDNKAGKDRARHVFNFRKETSEKVFEKFSKTGPGGLRVLMASFGDGDVDGRIISGAVDDLAFSKLVEGKSASTAAKEAFNELEPLTKIPKEFWDSIEKGKMGKRDVVIELMQNHGLSAESAVRSVEAAKSVGFLTSLRERFFPKPKKGTK